MDVNAKGVFLCCRAVLPRMLERAAGTILNIASQAGKRGYPKLSHYCASKWAVIGFTQTLALEVAPAVRVNAICPGIVATEMMDREYAWEEEQSGVPRAKLEADWLASIPMGRFQTPEHVAAMAAFLASEDASEITGEAVNVTGGGTMG
jgi:NAD(P)-dependent dehydrogenase (short-subunit alcohol dehydrogenase family)